MVALASTNLHKKKGIRAVSTKKTAIIPKKIT